MNYVEEPVSVDFFGEHHPVKMKDNPTLENMANHILNLAKHYPNLLDGDTMQEIDRKLLLAIWWEHGINKHLGNWESFSNWVKSKDFVDTDLVTRARRLLLSRDLIRVSSRALLDAERHRQRIERSVK